jgi:hydroxylaminobenzene mutase
MGDPDHPFRAAPPRNLAGGSRLTDESRPRTLVALGALLFLLGLLTGVLVPAVRSPRIALSAHLEGVMNGTFLMVLGAVWHHVRLSPSQLRLCFWLLVYGTFANWLSVLLGGVFGAGRMMPIAGGGMTAAPWQEILVGAGLVSLTIAMLVGCGLLVWGLLAGPGRGRAPEDRG